MFLSLLDASTLVPGQRRPVVLLPAVRWAGDADVTHTDGRREVVPDVTVCAAPRCNNTFVPSFRKQRFCTSECCLRAKTHKRRKRPPIVCARPYCEKEFVPRTRDQKFCSRRCSFKQLRYGRTNGLWRGIVAERNYTVKP